jgi:8-oxo-dGTP pyrophosphatase MutT (NUDIX family)
MPSVSVHVFDDTHRLLLVRQKDDGSWSTPGGVIEPDERPADAAVREAYEETGLLVQPIGLVGAYAGPECVVRYPNGDETQYVIIAFACTIVDGAARPDHEETVEVRFWSEHDAESLVLSPWLRSHLRLVYDGGNGRQFVAPTWAP